MVVCDILLRMKERTGSPESVGILDDNPGLTATSILGITVNGPVSRIAEVEHDVVIVAIGDNGTRRSIFLGMENRGENIVSAIHPASVIAPDVSVGRGTMICAGAVVNPGTEIGCNVILNTGCTVDHHNRIHDHVHIAPGAHLGGKVEVGEGTLVGIGTAVLPGVKIGRWCVVGAGSVVTKDIPDGSLAFGIPTVIRK